MTIFAKIAAGEIPATILYEDDHALVFEDAAPQAPTHWLVIPRKPIAKVAEAEDDDTTLLGHLLRVAAKVTAEHGIEDYRLVVNNGAGAGQTVFHLHVHILAGRPFTWPPG